MRKALFTLLLVSLSAAAGNSHTVEKWYIENDAGYSVYSSKVGNEELVIQCQLGVMTFSALNTASGVELNSVDNNIQILINGRASLPPKTERERLALYLKLEDPTASIQLIADKPVVSEQYSLKGLAEELRAVTWDLSNCRE